MVRLVLLISVLTALVTAHEETCSNVCCVLYDDLDDSKFFDLDHLTRTGTSPNYVVQGSSGSNMVYELNICAALNKNDNSCTQNSKIGDDMAACQSLADPSKGTENDRKSYPHALGKTTTFMTLHDDNDPSSGVVLKYRGGESCGDNIGQRSTTVQFSCNPDTRGSPEFLEETPGKCEYIFKWETDLVCEGVQHGDEVDCSTTDDKGRYYDLTPLIRSTRNWNVLAAGNVSYDINVCRSLVPVDDLPAECTGGAACQQESATSNTYSLGKAASPVYKNGAVILTYEDGTACDGGKPRRTRIELSCPTDPIVGLGQPRFLGESTTCEYEIKWETSAACAIITDVASEPVQSFNTTCQVVTSDGDHFDLSSLTNFTEVKLADATEVTISVCDQGVPCGNGTMAGICLTKDSEGPTSTVLASVAEAVEVEGNDVKIRYHGGTCPFDTNQTFSALIDFVCDHEELLPDSNSFLRLGQDPCSPVYEVKTNQVCTPEEVPCALTANGQVFDLSKLRLPDDNWLVVDPGKEDGKYGYLINVCQSIANTDDAKGCPTNAGICQIGMKQDDPFQPVSLGKPSAPFVNGDGKLAIQFTEGASCGNGVLRNSTLVFECSTEQRSPTFVDEVDTCQYLFQWETPLACAETTQTGIDCKVTSALGQTFDLTRLAALHEGNYVVTDNSQSYDVSLCSSDSKCVGGAAVCKGSTNYGKPKEDGLVINGDLVTLTYDGGSLCPGFSNVRASTTITFKCAPGSDGTAGPVVMADDGCNLQLDWYTSLVCTSDFDPIDCKTFDDDGNVYDLTRLMSATHNYQASKDGFMYEVNVCRPLVDVPGSTCPQGAAACQITPEANQQDNNLGQPARPKWDSDLNKLVLEYTGGSGPCHSEFNRSTRIVLDCAEHVSEITDLEFVQESPTNCVYTFSWATPVACPVTVIKGAGDCKIDDPVSDYTFDLSPLAKDGGHATPGDGYVFNINVCDNVPCGTDKVAGVCQTKASNNENYNTGNSTDVLQLADNRLLLEYEHGDVCEAHKTNRRTKIYFTCDQDAGKGAPTYVSELDGCVYVFEWKTSYACAPEIECKASDPKKDIDYHLSDLIRTDSNWIVKGGADADQHYELNVCRPAINTAANDCGGFSGACRVSASGKDYSLGHPSRPYIKQDGTLALDYSSGQNCPTGSKYSGTILFECNDEPGQLGSPEYAYSTQDGCHVVFKWRSSVACVEQPGERVGQCAVKDIESGRVYDFSAFSGAELVPPFKAEDEFKYAVGICREVEDAARQTIKCQGAGACQLSQQDMSVAYNMGQPNDRLQLKDGVLSLTYTNGTACDDTTTRKTDIIFHCDQSATSPRIEFGDEAETCVYFFNVYTDKACDETVRTSCIAQESADNSGRQIDLSSLIKTDGDYIADGGSSPYGFKFNVCRNLVSPPGAGSGCGGRTGMCAYDSRSLNAFSLGNAMPPIINQQGQLTLSFYGGACPVDQNVNATAMVFIECPADGVTTSIPKLMEPSEQCSFAFTWEHPIACAEVTTTPAPLGRPVTVNDCKFEDAQGITFDLTSLANADVEAILPANDNEYQYSIRVCNQLATKCGNEYASGCQHKEGVQTSIGTFKKAPFFKDGDIVLTYEDGTVCGENKRSTSIRFICAPDVDVGRPEYVGETTKCVYEFEWRTSKACGQGLTPTAPLQCAVEHDGVLYDFNILRKQPNAEPPNWLAVNSDGDAEKEKYDFYLSVCEPLHAYKGMSGCAGAGICQHKEVAGFSPRVVGQANHEPEVVGHHADGKAQIVMRYTLPDDFESEDCVGDIKRRAVVNFFCQPGQLGQPEYVGESETCLYAFNWYTSAACGEEVQTGGNCTVVSDKTGQLYDLRGLQGMVLPASSTGVSYELAICAQGSRSSCEAGSGACSKGTGAHSIGRVNQDLILEDEEVSLVYSNGASCGGSSTLMSTTTLLFACDRTATTPKAEFVAAQNDCDYTFRVRTKLVCPVVVDQECVVVDSDGYQHDLSVLKRFHGESNWQVKDEKNNDFDWYINVCHSLALAPHVKGCGNAAACQIDSHGVAHSLGNPSAPFINSDGKIQLSYTGGEPCSNGKTRSVDIIFTCQEDSKSAQPLGQPEFSSENSCSYTMYWTTTAACRIDDRLEKGCQLVNKVTEDEFNLAGLDASTEHAGVTYHVSACKPFACAGDDKSFGCQTTPTGTFSLGQSGGMELLDNRPLLKLSGGTACHNGAYHRSAYVNFVCSTDGTEELSFTFEDTSECTYYLTWTTPKACPIATASAQCLVQSNGWDLDFAPLSASLEKGAVSLGNNPNVIINVCAAVVDNACPEDAAVCSLKDGLSWGSFLDHTFTSKSDGTIQLKYSQGDYCIHNRNVRYTTTINFKCSHEEGEPKVTSDSDACDVQVEWATCRACAEENPCRDPEPGSGTGKDKSTTQTKSKKKSKGGVVVAVVVILALIGAGGAYYMVGAERRASLFRGCSKTDAPKFRYSKLDENTDLESSMSLTDAANLFDDDSDDDDDDDDDDEIIAIE
eukprot:m.269550 g.269550  ORF g.269550 m.269550 type:complete len:2501 (+) comp17662_c0_seq1:233-7735(+)